MAKKVERLTLTIGITKSNLCTFEDGGSFLMACPKCGMPIEIVLSGLPSDSSISPSIDYKHEWHLEEAD